MSSLWRRWVLANVIGEIVGFGLAGAVMVLVGDLVASLGGPTRLLATLVAVLVLGCVEGLAVGYAQWQVLRASVARLTRGAWIRATVAGAAIAWVFGMTVGTLGGDALVSDGADMPVLGALLIGAAAGTLLAIPQSFALGRCGVRASWWVPAHTVAWMIGMVVAYAGIALLPPSVDVLSLAATTGLTGLAMGATVAAITGLAVIATLSPTPSRSPALP